MLVVDRRRACPEHEAALRAGAASQAAVARGQQRFRLRRPTSRSALGRPGRFAIPVPAMRARLPGRRVHREHLAPAGRDGVRGVVTARLPSTRCPEHGDLALTPSWASDHVSLRDVIRDRNTGKLGDPSAHPQLASRASTRGLGASPPASSSLTARRPFSRAVDLARTCSSLCAA